jgi:hypothetical protein
MIIFRCEKCGSSQVSKDADANWDVEQQAWVLGTVSDTPYCHPCGEEVPLVMCVL